MFNPPHIGHLICAHEAVLGLGLQRLICVPVGVPVHKRAADDPGPERRLQLCRQAFSELPQAEVSSIETDSSARSYTVNTLEALTKTLPDDSELMLILGSDAARSLPRWHRPERILELATVAVVERPGVVRSGVQTALAELSTAARLVWFEMPSIDISSSFIRARVKAGRSVKYLVPQAVERMLETENLYP